MVIKQTLSRFLISALLLGSSYTHAQVQVILEKFTIELGETVQMTILSENEGALDMNSLEQLRAFFQIGATSQQQQIKVINGKRSVSNSWNVLLTAKKIGKHRINAFQVGKERSQPFDIAITGIQTSQNAAIKNAEVLLLGEVDNENPYVKSEVVFTLKLMYVHHIFGGQLSNLVIDNLPVKAITKEKRYSLSRNGKQYKVIEWRFAFIPRTSGDTLITPVTFNGDVQTSSGRKRMRLATNSINLKVRAQPLEWSQINADWLPAKNLNIWEKWQPSVNQWVVGQRYRREIKIDAMGIEAKQIADLSLPTNVSDYSIYPENPARKEGINEQGHTAQYSHQVDYVPNKMGVLTLAEIKIPWWDVKQDKLRYAILPSRQITVLPNKLPTQNKSSPNQSNQTVSTLDTSSSPQLIVDVNALDEEALNTLKTQLTEGSIISSVNLSMSMKAILASLLLIYSVILIMLGIFIGKRKRHRAHRVMKKIPASLDEAIRELLQVVKKGKNRDSAYLYQMILRCYNKHHNKLSLPMLQQWLRQIEQLRRISQEDSTQKTDFKTLEKILRQSKEEHNKKNISPLPALYPNT